MPGMQSAWSFFFVIIFLHCLWRDVNDSLSFNLEFDCGKPKHVKLILLYRASALQFAELRWPL